MEKRNDKKFFKYIKKTWEFMKDSKKTLVGYLFTSILEGIIGIILPIFSAKIILNITDGTMQQLLYTAITVLVIELVLYLVFYYKGFLYQKAHRRTAVNLQFAVARETLKLEVKEMDKESSGLFIDRVNNDTQEISTMFMEYTYWISSVISHAGILFTVFFLNKYMFVYAIFTALIIFLINKNRLKKQYEIQKEFKKLRERRTGLVGEVVRGIRDIKVLNAEEAILKQALNRIEETSSKEIELQNVRRKYLYFENNARIVSDFLFLVFGCFLYGKGLLTIPSFVIIYNYQSRIKNLLTGVVQILEYNKKFTVAAERIFEVIEDERFSKEKFGSLKVPKLSGNIEFKNVVFSYDDKKIINKMNFEILPNEKVAFVGKSGVGKTTIFNLITKLYDINRGKILLDGNNIKDLDRESLRNNMSIITQSPYIFNFTIKENLLMAKDDASMDEIREACKMACIDEFIMSLPEGYETKVGENGIILSGGQKQRLAIARALLMKTEIILFDEATSALDNETQDEIQKAIENLKGEYTILIVAHRLSTVIDSDRIFVVDDGKIIASGKHKELLKNCEFYKSLYKKDLNV